MPAPTLMVQGTASSVGKSLLVTALCRYFARHGIRVAPFKAQNMSLNAAVSCEGLEIGRAQAVQAAAAMVPASVAMNPILLKPESNQRAQLVVDGRVQGHLHAGGFNDKHARLAPVVARALAELRERYELVVIEGAGSPAEINLRAGDIVNMHVAKLAGAPVLLAGDIDRGGVFAALVGTLELLEPEERAHIAGFLINKFRGNLELLRPGLDMLQARTGVPVLGVVPFLPEHGVAREDSAELEQRVDRPRPDAAVEIAVIATPYMSNHDDFEPLERDPNVRLRFVVRAEALGDPALVVLPGSKCTSTDLESLRARGFEDVLARHVARGGRVLGICGGCQILGERIEDPERIESTAQVTPGLGLLPLRTRFTRDKVTANIRARPAAPSFLTAGLSPDSSLTGYEIHMGRLELTGSAAAPFMITERNAQACSTPDGASSRDGRIVGTLVHGLFDNPAVRRTLIEQLAAGSQSRPPMSSAADDVEARYDRLARAVTAPLDVPRLWSLTGLHPRRPWPDTE